MSTTQVCLWRTVRGRKEGEGGVDSVDIPITSSRLLHLQRGDRGQKTLPSSYFDWNANIIWLEIVHLQDFNTQIEEQECIHPCVTGAVLWLVKMLNVDLTKKDKLSKGGVGQIPNIRWWDFSRWRFGSADISRDRKTNSFLSVAAFSDRVPLHLYHYHY